MNEISQREFGAMTAQVAALTKQVDALGSDVKTLLEMANKSRGGLWAGMAIASALGGFITFVVELFLRK